MATAMDQISKPFLVALIAVVGFAGAWIAVLRPRPGGDGGGSTPAAAAPAAPGTKGLGRAVARARGAVAASERSASAAKKDASNPDLTPYARVKSGPPAVTAAPAAASPKPAAAARTTVLLFAANGADDAAARRVVRSVRSARVRVVVAGVKDVPRYAGLLGSAQVDAAPTIFVIGPDREATRIVGLPDREQVLQAISVRG